jgi:hypothetical protein
MTWQEMVLKLKVKAKHYRKKYKKRVKGINNEID